jgi:hypothetical protein
MDLYLDRRLGQHQLQVLLVFPQAQKRGLVSVLR